MPIHSIRLMAGIAIAVAGCAHDEKDAGPVNDGDAAFGQLPAGYELVLPFRTELRPNMLFQVGIDGTSGPVDLCTNTFVEGSPPVKQQSLVMPQKIVFTKARSIDADINVNPPVKTVDVSLNAAFAGASGVAIELKFPAPLDDESLNTAFGEDGLRVIDATCSRRIELRSDAEGRFSDTTVLVYRVGRGPVKGTAQVEETVAASFGAKIAKFFGLEFQRKSATGGNAEFETPAGDNRYAVIAQFLIVPSIERLRFVNEGAAEANVAVRRPTNVEIDAILSDFQKN